MIERQPGGGQTLAPLSQEDKKRRRRWLVLLLLLLLLVPICLWLVSQLALVALGIDEAQESLLSRLQATYVPWDQAQFGPLDPALIGTIRAEQATFVANAARPGGVLIIPFVSGPAGLTQIAANASATPTTRAMPTSTATRGPTSTPIIIIYPATSTDTSGTNPTPDWTTPLATSAPPSTTVPPPTGPSATPNPTSIPPPRRANLSITKTDGTGNYTPGASTTYTIVVRNNGPANVVNATVTDTSTALVTIVSWTCSASAGSSCPSSGSGNINASVNLLNNGTATFTVNATISAAATGPVTNTATVTPPAGVVDPVPGNNTAVDTDVIPASADLAITKGNGKLKVWPGGQTTYTIVVTNAGPSGVTGATVTDNFVGVNTVTWTCAPAVGASCTPSGTGDINDSSVNIPAGSSVTYTVDAIVDATPTTGTLSNTATVAPPAGVTDPTLPNSATDTDPIGMPTLSIALHWDSSDGTFADLDPWVYDPSTPDPLINAFGPSSGGGVLSTGDLACVSGLPINPTEQIDWPGGLAPSLGTYDVYVFYFQTCLFGASGTITWTLTVTIDGTPTYVISGTHTGSVLNPTNFVPPQNLVCPGTQLFSPTASAQAACSVPFSAFPPPPPPDADPRADGNPPTFSFILQ